MYNILPNEEKILYDALKQSEEDSQESSDSEDSEKNDNTATPNFNHSPINSIKITQLNPRKFSTVAKENINQAVLDNMNKKKYTAYTYSTIQKKKDTTKPKKSKNTYYIINI